MIKLDYKSIDESSNARGRGKNRPNKIPWFTPPFNIAETNKLVNELLKLLKKDFSF